MLIFVAARREQSLERPSFLTIFLTIVVALCILVSGLLPLLLMRDTRAYGVLIWLDAALLILAFSSVAWMLRKRWALSHFEIGMVDWKGSFQLFANVVGFMGLGALIGLAAAAALMGSFRIDYGYLPLLGALTAGAITVGLGIGIGALRKPP